MSKAGEIPIMQGKQGCRCTFINPRQVAPEDLPKAKVVVWKDEYMWCAYCVYFDVVGTTAMHRLRQSAIEEAKENWREAVVRRQFKAE